jgi:hypothetical protein
MATWSDKAQRDLVTYSQNAPPPHGKENLSFRDHTQLKHAVERWADQIGQDQASNNFNMAGLIFRAEAKNQVVLSLQATGFA